MYNYTTITPSPLHMPSWREKGQVYCYRPLRFFLGLLWKWILKSWRKLERHRFLTTVPQRGLHTAVP